MVSRHRGAKVVLTLCSFKLIETETVLAFMDIGPIAKGHCLVIPKCE